MGGDSGEREVREVVRIVREPPAATGEAPAAIEGSDAVVIGPVNPARSILPILECGGVRDLLRERFVVAVSHPGRQACRPLTASGGCGRCVSVPISRILPVPRRLCITTFI